MVPPFLELSQTFAFRHHEPINYFFFIGPSLHIVYNRYHYGTIFFFPCAHNVLWGLRSSFSFGIVYGTSFILNI